MDSLWANGASVCLMTVLGKKTIPAKGVTVSIGTRSLCQLTCATCVPIVLQEEESPRAFITVKLSAWNLGRLKKCPSS